MPKEIASRLFESRAMTSETFGFFYDSLQLAAGSFIRVVIPSELLYTPINRFLRGGNDLFEICWI